MTDTEYYACQRDDIFPFIPQNLQRTLDVGCASGIFSSKLKAKMNAETWGIEMVAEPAMVAKEKLDHVLIGTMDEVYDQLPLDYFDCIFFNDVLEHMPNPEECLRKVKANLYPGKYIVASIPNVRFIKIVLDLVFGKDFRYTDSGIMDKTHLRFFTKKSMIRMFENCGYDIQLIKGINGVGFCLTSVLNMLAFNKIEDVKYQQYLIVATPKQGQ